MKRKRNYFLFVVVIILIIVISYFGSKFLAIYRLELMKVCVANVSIPERTLISEEYLNYINVPKVYINDECYINKEDIVGKYVKHNAYVPKGSIIYKEFLEETNEMKDYLHLGLKEDETTYDLFVKDIKVNPAHLSKDMNVDLYLTINRKDIYSDLLISGAKITGLYDINNKEIKSMNDDSTLGTISITVKKDMVPYINKAITIGEVSLLVSNGVYEDKEITLNTSSEIYKQLS